ncbi:MAG: hypothetical protein KAY39_02080, partial [Burkholderiaceae bacterium]|nr:hypothetical protein [Burkholderiaceae bacterium]
TGSKCWRSASASRMTIKTFLPSKMPALPWQHGNGQVSKLPFAPVFSAQAAINIAANSPLVVAKPRTAVPAAVGAGDQVLRGVGGNNCM